MQDLFVSPAARKSGAGRALIDAVYTKADEAGAPLVYWNTQENNVEARKLYDKVAKLRPFVTYRREL